MTDSHPMPAAHTNPVAASVAAVMKSAVSNRVSFQSLRILRLNVWDCLGAGCLRPTDEWLRMFRGRFGGDLGAASGPVSKTGYATNQLHNDAAHFCRISHLLYWHKLNSSLRAQQNEVELITQGTRHTMVHISRSDWPDRHLGP